MTQSNEKYDCFEYFEEDCDHRLCFTMEKSAAACYKNAAVRISAPTPSHTGASNGKDVGTTISLFVNPF